MERMGIADAANEAAKNLCAPMPGRVLEIRVKAGDELVSGEALIVLEAMKMENVLAAQGDVKVSVVHVATGESVEKGAVLIEFT
jgi:acetyl/propionyl-CoA carboxylase alpha subunit